MRVIYALLATAQLRWARFDMARGDALMDNADEAFARARQRIAYANRLADLAGLSPARIPSRF